MGRRVNHQQESQIYILTIIAPGLLDLKRRQDSELPRNEAYIRFAAEVPELEGIIHDEDELDEIRDPIRIIICMSKEGSQHLLGAQFLQSDIGFKRVIGFHEFELGGRDPKSRTSTYHLYLCSFAGSQVSSQPSHFVESM